MNQALPIALAAALLLGAEGAHATPITITGTYTITDQSVTNEPTLTANLGTAGSASANSITGTFTETFTSMNSATTATAFFTTSPPGGPANGTQVSDNFTATFSNLTLVGTPNTSASNVSAMGTYAATYPSTDTDDWNGATQTTSSSGQSCYSYNDNSSPTADACVTLIAAFGATGDSLAITLSNAADWDIQPFISFELVPTSTTHQSGVPEPASLALLGSALAGLGLMRRRRNAG